MQVRVQRRARRGPLRWPLDSAHGYPQILARLNPVQIMKDTVAEPGQVSSRDSEVRHVVLGDFLERLPSRSRVRLGLRGESWAQLDGPARARPALPPAHAV